MSDAETTVVFDVTLDVAGVAEPIVGRMIGLPEGGAPRLDQLVIRRGRAPERGAAGEVVVSEGFANTRDLGPGKSVTALINGRKETLHIVGVGLSPDYIYATRGGAFPDDRNFGVFWIARERLAAAYNMEGAFNHVARAARAGRHGARRHRCARPAAGALRRHERARPRRAAVEPHPRARRSTSGR